MNMLLGVLMGLGAAILLAIAAVAVLIRARNMQRWIGPYVATRVRRRMQAGRSGRDKQVLNPSPLTPTLSPHQSGRDGGVDCGERENGIDVYIALCDHFEPQCYGASLDVARRRVRRWVTDYPRMFEPYRDADGRPPQHTFFFPQDEYRPEYLDELKTLCEAGYGDVDIHLHHDGDTADSLRNKLEDFRDTLHHRHELLRIDPLTGQVAYGFIHGNWALCNSRPNGRWCGVDQELTVLMETGCYADFTFPSAPDPTQPRTINSIYYAQDIPGRRMSHNQGRPARAGWPAPGGHLLMVQGPLCLDWGRRKFGVVPRIENADLHAGRPATLRRLQLWLDCRVRVEGRPDQLFIKLHTHGCKDGNIDTLLGPETQQFHADLSRYARERPAFRYHYVTAWEMVQRIRDMEGHSRVTARSGMAVKPALMSGI